MTEDEMVGCHHQLDGHDFEQALGVDDGHGSLACYGPWCCEESNTTEWLNWTELNHSSMVTHLELDILECEVKWTLGNITTNRASGGDGIPPELFQILKDNVKLTGMLNVKCCTEYVRKFGELSSGHRTGKGQFSFQSQRKTMPKNVQAMLYIGTCFTC